MQFKLFSIAAHSTWLYNKDYDFAIDAGEGIATHIGLERMGALKTLVLTHDHYDHVAGLVQLLNLRERNKNCAPLAIYYPYESHKLDAFRGLMPERAEWVRVSPGDKIPISKKLFAVPVPVNHAGGKAVGYHVFESRKRRRAEFAELTEGEMGAMARKLLADGRDVDFMEDFEHHYLTHTGDTMPLDPAIIGRPEVLIHEATYAKAEMLTGQEHSTLADALAAREVSGAKTLIVNHLSKTYRDVLETVDFQGALVVSPIPAVQTFLPGGEAPELQGRTGSGRLFNPTSLLLRKE